MVKFLIGMICVCYVLGAVGMEANLVAEDWSEDWSFDSNFADTLEQHQSPAMAWPNQVTKEWRQ